MIQRELAARGRTRDRSEIRHAIAVMKSCVITFYQGDKEIWTGAILQDLTKVDRVDYLADADAHHVARLPLFISHAINNLEYRQFNYARLMSCNEQLTRWIYKRLVNRFRQASITTDYHFMYSEIEQSSGLLQQATKGRNQQKVISALDELKERGVVIKYEPDVRKKGRNITDIKYTLWASGEFIGEQKAANLRATSAKAVGLKTKLLEK